MANPYNDNSNVFDAYAGPMLNDQHLRTGKVVGDADRILIGDMFPSLRAGAQNLGSILARRIANSRTGNVQQQTGVLQDRAIGNGELNAQAVWQRLINSGINPEALQGIMHESRARGVMGANTALFGEEHRQQENDDFVAKLLDAIFGQFNGVANRQEQSNQAGKMRKLQSDASNNILGSLAGVAAGAASNPKAFA
jgi:hypothetical protein